jgi:hypothetical protein
MQVKKIFVMVMKKNRQSPSSLGSEISLARVLTLSSSLSTIARARICFNPVSLTPFYYTTHLPSLTYL